MIMFRSLLGNDRIYKGVIRSLTGNKNLGTYAICKFLSDNCTMMLSGKKSTMESTL
jgi:hypothetical protein